MKRTLSQIVCAALVLSVMTGCGVADGLNPYSDGSTGGDLGERNTNALGGGGGGGKQTVAARHALEVMGQYERALPPQPYYPVVKPAEVRLMWIPDHMNRLGDLVPAHYYYLRVTRDNFAMQDAFDIERSLSSRSGPYAGSGPAGGGSAGALAPSGDLGTGNGGGGATPWQNKEGK
ncbi:MAG: hypothetical protein U0136_16950 [Bdellovibrionota bacterium]